jgi:hypothetical protein
MTPTREYTHARWHSRGGFLLTTLLVLLVMGAPFLVTRGLLTHGALFLPACACLVMLFGGPLIRLGLAGGRLDQSAPGRESVQAVQALIRVVLAGVLLVLGARAAGWIFAEAAFGIPPGTLDYQARELTASSTAWHDATLPFAWWGIVSVAAVSFILLLFARRKRLAGLSWIAGWLLAVIVVLMLLGLLVGYSMQGAGALAAMAAPVKLNALWSLAFWGDAAAVAMLAVGAQTGITNAAGHGLPKRAAIGREARILVAGVTFVLVLTGLVGLLLLSAVCYRQGIMPEPEHAAPGVMIMEVIPALGADLFQGWSENLRPTGRQVTLGWCFIIALACCVGVAAMLGAQRLFPRDWRSPAARFGFAAAAVCLAALVASLVLGTSDAYLPLLTVMPALLAVILVTIARRSGTGMRVVSVAFESSRPWLERLYLTLTFRVVRPLLLLAVVAVALSRSEYNVMLAGFAAAFALVWIGTLHSRQRRGETGMLRVVAASVMLAAPIALMAQAPADRVFDTMLDDADPALRGKFEALAAVSMAGGETIDATRYREAALLYVASDFDRARLAGFAALLLDPAHEDALRLERELLEHDGVAPFPRLDEAFSDYQAGEPGPLIARLQMIQSRIGGRRLLALLRQEDAPAEELMLALVADLRAAYGSSGLRGRDLRRYLVQRATNGRSLLRPDAGPGVTYLTCMLLAAGLLALALMLGIGRR